MERKAEVTEQKLSQLEARHQTDVEERSSFFSDYFFWRIFFWFIQFLNTFIPDISLIPHHEHKTAVALGSMLTDGTFPLALGDVPLQRLM